ncbi:loganic acid O-methyltransferase-like isoform X2 [Cornus florida]|uniref:loganic acid O-methyltransferase-like isoform X2 n=1 Tax=Cornus florida TaxID=4283 RepID=UPI00289A8FCF|nr:loganic acid O-methyltransferase-like isoform X2 [Cornus florida]XP_059649239.1 loganic acid O-methyltransferase-like isoform X2 [Cornus florida]
MSNKEAVAMTESYPMKGGDGTYSYTKNSTYQQESANYAQEMIDEAIAKKLDIKSLISNSSTLCIADLGCSVGPNTFIAMQNVLEAMEKKCLSQSNASKAPKFQVFFNDHAANDFNALFASLPHDRQYFAAGVPGSFHGRLFPESSLHFVYSSTALQWLSKLPEELLDKNSRAWNKGRIYYTSASEEVANAYAAQFTKDMKNFLNARAKEIVAGGMMVVLMPGLSDDIHYSQRSAGLLIDFIGSTLMDMVNEEIARLVEENGCFSIERMQMMDSRSKRNAPLVDAHTFIMHLRAAMEGVFTKHFGSEIVGEMFDRVSQKSAEVSCLLDKGYNERERNQVFFVLKHK